MRILKSGVITPVAAVLLIAFVSCGQDRPERSLGTREMADQEINDYQTTESDSGVVKWILEAPVARVYNVRKLLVTDNPRIQFFNEFGEVSSVLTADKGEFNQETRDLTVLGNVVVTTPEGYILETESLMCLRKVGQIFTEDFVKVTRENDILTGYGFQGYPELKNVDIKRDVKAYLRDDEGLVDEEIKKDSERKTD
ncbi:MAG: LPS export ABC transporter periplasmic protein LptC [Candidatus Krumholzibacteriota bacterium]|nr:LPS export ABC transporter periplasmic protein LptC [Candidatus Krumholzibacteriota bacterium]